MVIPYFPPHPKGEVISKWPRCSGTHMERQTQRGVRQKERRWLANAFFNERLPFRAISWRWLPNRKNTKKMRMYRPWGYIIQPSFSSFTGLRAVSIATAILNTSHRVIKITDPVVRPARIDSVAWIPIVLWWRSDSSVPYGISVLRSHSPKHMTHAHSHSRFGFQR